MYDLFIQRINATTKVDDLLLQDILERFKVKKIEKGTFMVREGGFCKDIFFINAGMVRTFIRYQEKEITTWVALPGTIETSAQSFLRESPSEISLQAITECNLLIMNRKDYYHLLKTNALFNDFAFRLMEDFYLRMENKFYSYLFLPAEERFIRMQRQFPEHFKHVPLKYLASILRIKPETLSRLRKKQHGYT
jgi:CRP-like cAMP-binding protein